ncbi:MAG: hypothetical protein ABEI52_07405 [Halobacteriaceae archaeon]
MSSQTAVFAAEDFTSYRSLRPVADILSREMDVEFLFLDEHFRRFTQDERDVLIPKAEVDFDFRQGIDYMRLPIVKRKPSTPWAITQRLLTDLGSYQLAFDIRGYVNEVEPTLFVSGVDTSPFIRHVIRECHDNECTTATIQHGIYEYALDAESLNNRLFFPNVVREIGPVEYLKRRVGFPYGITEYCHPYLDIVMTMGTFFTEQIRNFREEYPDFGKTTVETTGTPEFSNSSTPYEGNSDSMLFLSQTQYEGGSWTWNQTKRLVEWLCGLDEQRPLTVRPHPKDSEEKIRLFDAHLEVSTDNSLEDDIRSHDIILTVNSTAMFEGVIQGKACGVLQLPWDNSEFACRVHDHILQIDSPDVDVPHEAQRRSRETQRDFLNRFCFLPGDHEEVQAKNSADLIAQLLLNAQS